MNVCRQREPEAALGRGWTELFFVIFICITAFVIMGLFIGAITMGMIGAISDMDAEKEIKNYDESASSMALCLAPNGALARTMDILMSDEGDRSLGRAIRNALSGAQFDAGDALSHHSLLDTFDIADLPSENPSSASSSSTSAASFSSSSSSSSCLRKLSSTFVSVCFAIEQHWFFGTFVTAVILMVAVMIGIETDYGDQGALAAIFNNVFLGIFVAEVFIKTGSNAILPGTTLFMAFLRYLQDPWNKFDFFIVLVGIFEVIQPLIGIGGVDGLMALRLLRLLRIFRAAKAFPRLRALIDALTSGSTTAALVMILFAVLNFILACIGVLEFKQNDPFHFGDLSTALFSIWRIESRDGAFAMMKINTCKIASLFYLCR